MINYQKKIEELQCKEKKLRKRLEVCITSGWYYEPKNMVCKNCDIKQKCRER